ncbi:MAG: Plug domain-containing protein [Deltaproteobacteria bacterium]|nr:Plug domain-containing protein [Deltaproteobacteria bacterium]
MQNRRGDPVVCEAALLVERELLVPCSDEGAFVLSSASPLADGGETLVVVARGYRDHIQRVDADTAEVSVTLRRGVSRRSESVTRSAPHWNELARRVPEADRSFDLGGATVDAARHAETAGGYGDLNRSLQSAPGVSGDTAASARFRVRGAERGETLTLVDGIRIVDATHLNGIFGALDPDLVNEVRIEGVVPSASVPESNGGAVVARYKDGAHDRFDGAVDLSFLGAAAHGAVTLGKEGRGTRITLGVRRSFLQAYLAGFDALGLTDDVALDTVDFGSAFARVTVPTGKGSRLGLTLLHLHDRILLDDVNLRHRMLGGSLRWDLQAGPRTELFLLGSWAWEQNAEPETDFDYPGKRTWESGVHRGRALFGVEQGFGPAHTLRVGVDAGPVLQRARGELEDPWALPSWASLPSADLVESKLLDDREFNADHAELDLYAEAEFAQLGPVNLRVGARTSLLNASLAPRLSPRLAVTVPLPTGTVVRGGVALTHQGRPELHLLGATQDRPERALTASIGVGQELGGVAVLEVLAWGRALDHLLVPDLGTDGQWRSTGTGLAGGFDATGLVQLGRFEAHAAWSFLGTTRRNPTASDATGGPTAGDQRHDIEVGTRLFVGRLRNFVVGVSYSGASGPPTSSLTPVSQGGDDWLWSIGAVNDQRFGATHRLDLRLEHRIPTRFFRLRASFELNADLGGRVFARNCPATGVDGLAPECQALTFWPPLRPWLGLKAEW